MRILHITPDYYPAVGGGELFVKEISERLASRGHDVSVVATDSRGLSDPTGERLPSREVINRVNLKRVHNTYALHYRLLHIRGAYRALSLVFNGDRAEMLAKTPCSPRALFLTLHARADVVAAVNWFHGSLAYQTCLARDLGGFAFVGVPLFHTERPWAHSPLLAQMLARCDAVAAMTDHEKRFIEQRTSGSHPHVVGVGVEPELFAKGDGHRLRALYGIQDAPLVGYMGRMSATKGVITLIQAMRIVWQRDPRTRLLLAGSGGPSSPKCEDDIRRTLAELREAERARIVFISDFSDHQKASILDALDVFAMPSIAESFGIAYLEAWMCRKPVIGSRIDSTACVIRDEVDGLLVTPEDPRDLARSIIRLLADPDARAQMGRAGHAKTLASFTWEKVTDRIEHIYDSVRAVRAAVGRSARAVA